MMSKLAFTAFDAASMTTSRRSPGSGGSGRSAMYGLIAVRIAAVSSPRGSSFHELKTIGMERGVPRRAKLSSATLSSRHATPARSSELLPTPLSACNNVSRAARRFEMILPLSASRPKNHSPNFSP
jgi:hypothetical protein